MSSRARRTSVGVLLALYFLWPLVHQQLVLRYRIDPWKLAGWAMYTAPSARVRINLVGLGADGRRVRIDPRSPAELAVVLEDFDARRQTLGLFVEPDGVVRKLVEIYPDYREWSVVVDQVGLNSENRFGVVHRSIYHYPIDGERLGAMRVEYPAVPEIQAPEGDRGGPSSSPPGGRERR